MEDTIRDALREASMESDIARGTHWFWWPSFEDKAMYVGVDYKGGVVHYFHEERKDWIAELTGSELIRRMESVA